MERIAHGWELIRRVHPELNWPPFYDIGRYIAVNLRVRIIPESERFRFSKKITTEISPSGWTDEDLDGGRENLGLTKYALRQNYALKFIPTEQEIGELSQGSLTAKELRAHLDQRRKEQAPIAVHLRWIDAQAKGKGVELPRGLFGQHNRPPSWTMVEVLDIARYVAIRSNVVRKLSPGERKMKTIAMQKAKIQLAKYTAAMEEIKTMPGYLKGVSPDAIARGRRILLGDWVPPKTNW